MKPSTRNPGWSRRLGVTALALTVAVLGVLSAHAQTKKPNILVIWGDDIGTWNTSSFNNDFDRRPFEFGGKISKVTVALQ